MSLTRVVWYAIKIFEGKINETSCEMTVPATTALTSDFISMAEDDEEREEVLTLVSFKAKLCPNGCNMCHHFRGDCTFWWRGFAAQLTSACHLAVYCLWNNLFGSVQYGSDNSSLAEWVSLSAPTCSASGVHRPLRCRSHIPRGEAFLLATRVSPLISPVMCWSDSSDCTSGLTTFTLSLRLTWLVNNLWQWQCWHCHDWLCCHCHSHCIYLWISVIFFSLSTFKLTQTEDVRSQNNVKHENKL